MAGGHAPEHGGDDQALPVPRTHLAIGVVVFFSSWCPIFGGFKGTPNKPPVHFGASPSAESAE